MSTPPDPRVLDPRVPDPGVLGVLDLAAAYRTGVRDPVRELEARLAAIADKNDTLQIFNHVDEAGAKAGAAASAERLARGAPLSHLDGAPIAIKANIAVRGLPHHAGIARYRHQIAADDAACVARLRAAGAVILGLVNMHEGALGGTTDNPAFGRTQNPLLPGRTAGGSSGGSGAAVAAGFCAAALGTDTLGSVRIPAAYCGGVGIRPERDAVDREGVMPLSPTLDGVGVHAATAADARVVLETISGPIGPGRTGSLAYARLEDLPPLEPGIAEAYLDLLDRLKIAGERLEPFDLSDYPFSKVRRLGLLIVEAEGYVVHRAGLEAGGEGFSADFVKMLAWGGLRPAHELAAALIAWRDLKASLRRRLQGRRALVLPTTAQTAFAFDQPPPPGQADLTTLANVMELCACAFPIGGSGRRPPVSAQVVGWSPADLLDLAARFETIASTHASGPARPNP